MRGLKASLDVHEHVALTSARLIMSITFGWALVSVGGNFDQVDLWKCAYKCGSTPS